MTRLYVRLSLVFLGILLVFGGLSLWIADYTARAYFLESTQQLNAPIAMYMAQNAQLVTDGEVDKQALADLAEQINVINPSVELYLLNLQGTVIAQAAKANRIAPLQVDLKPVLDFLQGSSESLRSKPAVLGENPLNPLERRAFSAAPLYGDEAVIGYVYAVLAGKQHQNLISSIGTSYSVRHLAITLSGVLLLAALGGGFVFFTLTRRLKNLTQRVKGWQQQIVSTDGKLSLPTVYRHAPRDEVEELTRAYDAMALELHNQYHAVQAKDSARRELMANISHDLRTPLTSLQGYLETVLLKQHDIQPELQERYLGIAHKQAHRLKVLVDQLFELSKLDAGDVSLKPERFSLLELSHDALQDVEMIATEKGIECEVVALDSEASSFEVIADISLIHRVFENLLGNAIRYTSNKGKVWISLEHQGDEQVRVTVADTGAGMSEHAAKRVFEPRFTSSTDQSDAEQHAGLGLAIVQGIVNLHGSAIEVSSEQGLGTRFNFCLQTGLS